MAAKLRAPGFYRAAWMMVLGVAFGGVRLLTKIFFPGKVFDRQSSNGVLQLGLASKPINSDDFYQLGKAAPAVPRPGEI